MAITNVALAQSTNANMVSSNNGLTWTAGTMPVSGLWYALTHDGYNFIAAIANSTSVYRSVDGTTWTGPTTLPVSSLWAAFIVGDDRVVALARTDTANCAMSTDHGATWALGNFASTTINAQSGTFFLNKFYVFSLGPTNTYFSSTNGTTWTVESTLPNNAPSTSNYWMSAVSSPTKIVVFSRDSTYAAYSTNGTSWTRATLPITLGLAYSAYGNGRFVALQRNSATGVTSTDGITWTTLTLPVSSSWNRVTYDGTNFIAVSGSSIVLYSANGTSWTQVAAPAARTWNSVSGLASAPVATYNAAQFFMVME